MISIVRKRGLLIFVLAYTLIPQRLLCQAKATRCQTEPYHQLDFWLGKWTIRDPAGGIEGTNEVTKDYDGCVVIEHWQSSDQTGISLNFYDFRLLKWRQEWVDSFGNTLSLSGGLVKGRMTLVGDRPTEDGKIARERNVWFTDTSGRLRNVWDYSLDNGKTWIIRFDGVYERR